MSTYGGFAPGTYQPWALNLQQKSLGQQGIAHGMTVSPNSPAGMTVIVGLDPVLGDGVCFLKNGGWLRIDQAVTLSVPANGGGSTRTDAVVALVDPTGTTSSGLYYATSWTEGYAGDSNQFVVALVQVPAGASSIIGSNLLPSPLQANVGTTAPISPDALAPDTSLGQTGAVGVYTMWNVVLSSSATSNQTNFNVPLTTYQALVPMGRIGGAAELGYFASPAGWYMPKVTGSVSGNLPVASLNPTSGAITTSVGATSGEQVTVSYKYYDFSRDLHAWGSDETFLGPTAAYCVYQGEARKGTEQITEDVWDTIAGSRVLQAGETVTITWWGAHRIQSRWLTTPSTTTKVTTVFDGTTTFSATTLANDASIGAYSYGLADVSGSTSDVGLHTYQVTVNSGPTAFGGLVTAAVPVNGALYLDGGEAVVDGFTVYVTNASLNLTSVLTPGTQGQTGTVYLDRYGNLTTIFGIGALGEQPGLRIPIAQAVAYGSMLNTSAWYGTYAIEGVPSRSIPVIIAGNASTYATTSATAINHGWSIQNDSSSPYGAYLISSSTQDALTVAGWGTGLNLTVVAQTATPVMVSVDNATQYAMTVTSSGGNHVQLVVSTNWPAATHFVTVTVRTQGSNLGFEAAELREPLFPTPSVPALPLAEVLSAGANNIVRRPAYHDAQVSTPVTGHAALLVDPIAQAPGATVWLKNQTNNQSLKVNTVTYTAVRVGYLAGPSAGQFNVVVGGITTTVDAYATAWTSTATAWMNATGSTTVSVLASGTKNGSSGNTQLLITGVDTIQHPVTVLRDLRRLPATGVHPAIRGSGILSAQGARLADQGYGIATDHLQDRAVTSRKMAPTYARVVTTTAWSGAPGIDPFLQANITVEVPSMLFMTLTADPLVGTGSYAGVQLYLDGQVLGPHPLYMRNVATSGPAVDMGVTLNDIAVVGPGTHTIQYYLDSATNVPEPFYNGVNHRQITVLAFAL